MTAPAGFRGIWREDAAARAVYAEAAGIARITPLAVAVPADAADVASLVRWARTTATPLVARGSGSSMGGGAIGSGVIVDLSRLNHIGPVDVSRRRVCVGPGALRDDVDAAARRYGLRFPVDPSSGAFCTVGGMVATNAAGAHSLAFGSVRQWVRSLTCVFDDGSIEQVSRDGSFPTVPAIQRFSGTFAADSSVLAHALHWHDGVRKDSSGYSLATYARTKDLVDLFVGSEGTLALFMEIELDLLPVPGATSSVLGAFESMADAVVAATRAREAGAVACELLERTFLDVAAAGGHALPVPGSTTAVLLAEVEGTDPTEAAATARTVEGAFRAAGASTTQVALNRDTEEALWTFRHAASPMLSRLDPSLKSMQFIEDGAVPPSKLPEYVRGVREALDREGLRGVIFGHAGDSHMHVNPLVDLRQPDWREHVDRLLESVVRLTGSLGGTLSGEHGDGRLRAPLLDRVWPLEALSAFARVKAAFDPTDILNPGVKVATVGQRALGDIKYDPALPPAPAAAARALATIEHERAYAGFRLDLLRASAVE